MPKPKFNKTQVAIAKHKLKNGELSVELLEIANINISQWQDDMSKLIKLGYKISVNINKQQNKFYIQIEMPNGCISKDAKLYSNNQKNDMYLRYKHILKYIILKELK